MLSEFRDKFQNTEKNEINFVQFLEPKFVKFKAFKVSKNFRK